MDLKEIKAKAQAAYDVSPTPWKAGRMDMVSYTGDGVGPWKAVYGGVPSPNRKIDPLTGEENTVQIARGDGPGCREIAAHIASVDPLTVLEMVSTMEQLLTWVNDLQSGLYINCVYCGHRYGPSRETPATLAEASTTTAAEALRAHIEVCPAHPMSALKRENELLRAQVGELTEAPRPEKPS